MLWCSEASSIGLCVTAKLGGGGWVSRGLNATFCQRRNLLWKALLNFCCSVPPSQQHITDVLHKSQKLAISESPIKRLLDVKLDIWTIRPRKLFAIVSFSLILVSYAGPYADLLCWSHLLVSHAGPTFWNFIPLPLMEKPLWLNADGHVKVWKCDQPTTRIEFLWDENQTEPLKLKI